MLNDFYIPKDIENISLCAENPKGEKGKGGMATEGTGANAARELGQGWKVSPCIDIAPESTAVIADVNFMGAIKHIWCTIMTKYDRNLILRIYWDGSDIPSVEVPLTDFFAYAQNKKFTQISSLPVCVNPGSAFNCYWEMPFRKGFKMTVENLSPEKTTFFYQIDCEKKFIPENAMYFHAQFRRTNPLPYMEDYTILDNIEGNGVYVGTYMLWGVKNNGWWGEGEIKFFIDGDKKFPTICGTGTEDYFCGAYCFDDNCSVNCVNDDNGRYIEYTTPYTGMYMNKVDTCYNSQRRFNLYRWHITDPIYFKKDLKVTIQALGWRSDGRYLPLQDDISSVAYWYQEGICKSFPKLPDRNGLEII